MPKRFTLEENMKQIQVQLQALADEQDAKKKGAIRTTINNIKNRFRKYKDAKEKKELENRLLKLKEKPDQSQETKKKNKRTN